jgi:mannose-6-phosphate isomerase-like protein (cupin superfamily)
MAYAGQTISNPVSGERITFRRTAADTGGEVLELDLELSADGHVPGVHVHPSQEERFEVVSGTMRFRMGMRSIVAGAGDVVTIPAGTVHKFANAGDGPAQARVEIRPALRMEDLLTTACRLAEDGRTTRKGMPKPLDLALFTREFAAEVRAPFPPAGVVRALLAPLAWAATRRGLAERYAPRRPAAAEPARPAFA